MEVRAQWAASADSADVADVGLEDVRIVGSVAAALAIPHLTEDEAAEFAAAHGVVCHLTSLVLVDEAPEAQAGLPAQRKVPLMSPAMLSQGSAYYVPSMPAHDILCDDGSAMEARCKSLPPSFAPMTPMDPPLTYWAGRIDWSNGEALRRGNTHALPTDLVLLMEAASGLDAVIELARALGIDAVVVVIALLAKTFADTDRRAARVFRAVLGKADPAKVDAAVKAIGC